MNTLWHPVPLGVDLGNVGWQLLARLVGEPSGSCARDSCRLLLVFGILLERRRGWFLQSQEGLETSTFRFCRFWGWGCGVGSDTTAITRYGGRTRGG